MTLVAVLDTETTGMGRGAEVLELAIAMVECDPDTGERVAIHRGYHGLREPKRGIDPRAQAVNGITMEEVAGHEFDSESIQSLLRSADVVVAHNCQFDRGMLLNHFPWVNELNWKCSCLRVKWRTLGYPDGKLQTLLRVHGISPRHAHRAAGDVEALCELLERRHPHTQRPFMWHVVLSGR